jgi:hypothetical protein
VAHVFFFFAPFWNISHPLRLQADFRKLQRLPQRVVEEVQNKSNSSSRQCPSLLGNAEYNHKKVKLVIAGM